MTHENTKDKRPGDSKSSGTTGTGTGGTGGLATETGGQSPDKSTHRKDNGAPPSISVPMPSTNTPTPPSTDATQNSEDARDISHETMTKFILQSVFPLSLAALGLICVGLFLNAVQDGTFYGNNREAMMLTPILLGMKGNLEMMLASRLSTNANLGRLDHPGQRSTILFCNMALVITHSSVLSFVAAIITLTVSFFRENSNLTTQKILLICSTAMLAAMISAMCLGLCIVCMVLLAKKYRINPDNVIAPMAASLGDFLTLVLFTGIGTMQQHFFSKNLYISALIILTVSCVTFVLGYVAYKEPRTRSSFLWGWIPVVFALAISSVGGYLLESAVQQFPNVTLFQPLIAGFAGNRGAVQCSRMSTCFHAEFHKPGVVPTDDNICKRLNPLNAYNGHDIHSRTALLLIFLSLPLQFGFCALIICISQHLELFNFLLLGGYLAVVFLQISLVLYIAQVLVFALWRFGTDPDNCAIPLLTAISDVFGTGFLCLLFWMLAQVSPSSIGEYPLETTTLATTIKNLHFTTQKA